MKILDFLRFSGIIPSLEARSKEEVLAELVAPIVQEDPDLDKEGLIRTLVERRNLGSTGDWRRGSHTSREDRGIASSGGQFRQEPGRD